MFEEAAAVYPRPSGGGFAILRPRANVAFALCQRIKARQLTPPLDHRQNRIANELECETGCPSKREGEG